MNKAERQIAGAAILVMSLFVLSRLLGLGRQVIIGAMFGTSGELDAYMAAARIPEMIFLVMAGGALGSAFIPTFADHLTQKDFDGAWELASAISNLALLALTITSALVAVLAPMLVRTVIAPGFDPAQQILTVRLLRIMLISPIIFGVSGVVMGVLNAHQHFLFPALAPSIYNLSIIAGALFLGRRIGVLALAVGVVIGSGLHLLVQLPQLLRYGARYVPTLGLHSPSVLEVGRLIAPRVLGTAIVQINFVINNSLASRMGEGAVSAINFAWMLMLLPQGVFAQAVGTAAFPTFAAQSARKRLGEMRHTLASTLRTVMFLSLPATAGLVVLADPFVRLLFERGAFEAKSTTAVSWALTFYALGLVGHAGIEIIARAFYALHDTVTPVWVGGVAVGTNVTLSLMFPPVFAWLGLPPFAGLALASSIAALLEFSILLWMIRRRLGGLEGVQSLTAVAKSGAATLVMGGALWGFQSLLPNLGTIPLSFGGIGLGALVYLGVTIALRAEEPKAALRLLRRS
jgi:putative peptidoglycan lipid II flippase